MSWDYFPELHYEEIYGLYIGPIKTWRERMDKTILGYKEALYIEKIRNEFYIRLDKLLENERER